MPVACVLLGVLPVVLYGFLYLKKIVFFNEENSWEDFYGFNAGGRWLISFIAMVVATFVLSFVLYFVSNVLM